MANLYRVEVLQQEPLRVRLRLQLTRSADGVVPLGPSFASMLVEEESSPAHAAWKLWINAKYDEDEEFDPAKSIVGVAIVAIHGALGEPSDAADDEFFGAVELEIRTTTAGLLDHLAPGTQWWSTAYDELGNCEAFTGDAEDVRSWPR